jgi:membrane fusion protein, multidrug efflux system
MNIHLLMPPGEAPTRPEVAKLRMSLRNLARLGAGSSLLLLAAACSKPPAPPPQGPAQVGVVTLQAQPVTRVVELPGRTNPTLTSDVRPQVNGIVKRRVFTEGSNVTAGQVLYEIDPAPYQAALDQAKGQLANAQAALTTARLQAGRYADLVKINAVSRQDNDNAQASYQQALATVQADKAAVEAASINLGYTKVRAPISGRIGRDLITPGALVSAQQTNALATIQSLSPIYVDVTQSADQLLAIRKALSGGQLDRTPSNTDVKLVLADGTPYAQTGQLKFSDVTVDQTTDSVTLRAVFPNPNAVLLPGMFVRERLNEGVYPNAVLAPAQGVSHDPKGAATALVVGADGKAEPRMLKVAGMQGADWIVLDGLHPGDRLIVQGLLTLQPGMPVKPIPAQLPTAPAADVPTAQGAGG